MYSRRWTSCLEEDFAADEAGAPAEYISEMLLLEGHEKEGPSRLAKYN